MAPKRTDEKLKTPLNKSNVEGLVSTPILDTLWQRCFWEIAEKSKKEGAETIEFDEVDNLALEKSKMAIPDLLKWLGC